MLFIIKFFPEIIIKSKPVRQQMVRQLKDNLYSVLRPLDENTKIFSQWDKMSIETSLEGQASEEFKQVLCKTPGISKILQVKSFQVQNLNEAAEITFSLMQQSIAGRSFVVRCKRTGKHDFNSTEIERQVGGYLLHHAANCHVDLHQPDVVVNIELHGETLYVVDQTLDGLGGFPLGQVEPVLSLISGGFDSPVASFLMTKRGMPTHYCFFNLGGRDHELGVKEVAYHLWQTYGSSHKVKFVSVPFEGVVAEILEKVDNSQMGVILKRMMLRAASRVAEKLGLQALVTGEAVAQVSSQTLTNLAVIDEVCDMLVLRPLIAMDKSDIINKAREIGTEVFAANMPEYCGVISIKPTTRARLYRIQAEEENFSMSVLEQAIEQAQFNDIDQLDLSAQNHQEAEVFSSPQPDSTIIDIRHPDEQEQKPLNVAGQTIVAIPFYRLHKQLAEMDKKQRYLLYCGKGVMSRLHAAHLLEDGFNIAVYQPNAK